jgi:aryl-alcohol dehydrogenase-like predicted oxidoreductase
MISQRTLGRTGLSVSEISFGAWQIGGKGYGDVSETEAMATIEAYLEQGGNFIDTARGYGESERLLGEYFQHNGGRDNVVIASKSHKLASEVRDDVETTLRLLQTDYVDLLYLHSPPEDPEAMNRTLDIFEELKSEGKIRAIGSSIKGPNVTEGIVNLCHQYMRTDRVDVLMIIYSIFRQGNDEVIAEAMEKDIGIVARTVLESGFLTGKYKPGTTFTGRDHRKRWGPRRLSRMLQEVQELKSWAVLPPYEDLTQVAIRFVLDTPGVSSVVVGARTPQQIIESAKVSKLPPLPEALGTQLIETYRGRDDRFNTGEDK